MRCFIAIRAAGTSSSMHLVEKRTGWKWENRHHYHQGIWWKKNRVIIAIKASSSSSMHLVERGLGENENILYRKDGQLKKRRKICKLYRARKELSSSWLLTTMDSLVFIIINETGIIIKASGRKEPNVKIVSSSSIISLRTDASSSSSASMSLV